MNRKRSKKLLQSIDIVYKDSMKGYKKIAGSKDGSKIDVCKVWKDSSGIGELKLRYIYKDEKGLAFESCSTKRILRWNKLSDNDREEVNRLFVELSLDEDGYPRYEGYRICSHCGCAFQEGYYLGTGYACSDECRDEMYIEDGCKDKKEAYRQYVIDCYYREICGYFGVNSPEEVENLTARRISILAQKNDWKVSDECYCSVWC